MASARGREVLMFLGAGFTSRCWRPKAVLEDPNGYEDGRCALIGNSFHAGVVALIFSPLMLKYSFFEDIADAPGNRQPNDVASRQGLQRGLEPQQSNRCVPQARFKTESSIV